MLAQRRWLVLAVTLFACGDDGLSAGGGPGGGGGDGIGGASSGAGGAGGESGCEACPLDLVCDEESATCSKEGTTTVIADDGTRLSTWVVLPERVPPEGVPALLARTPYGSPYSAATEEFYRDMARVHAARGYAYVLQDVRGRGKSEGEFIPETYEIVDGRTTTEWMVSQPWANGRIGTIGGSYLGYTALAAAIDNPLVSVVIADDTSNDERTTRPGGTVWTYTLGWVHYLENGTFPPDAAYTALPDTLDLMAADTALLGHDLPYWNGIVLHDDIGPWPEGSIDIAAAGGGACVPALFVYSSTTLWRDPLTAYRAFRDLGCSEMQEHQRLVLTHDPHTYHLSLLGFEDTPVTTLMFDTIDNYLKGDGEPLAAAPVMYNPPGDDAYVDATAYPGSSSIAYYLSTGSLGTSPGPITSEAILSDPAVMSPCGGDYPYLELTTGPLAAELVIVGEPTLDLVATTDLGDFDVFASLYEYNPAFEGGVRFVQMGSQRATYRAGDSPVALPAAGEPIPIRVDFLPLAHRVEAGSELVLYLSTADCVAFENPQSGELPSEQTTQLAGTVTFELGGESKLELPVIP
ncbi:MAG: CocE/NonD family hydrolase [Myxococcales bacterium]|nr:CocE/NonD family hydrolase [Myxococcales bacterium]